MKKSKALQIARQFRENGMKLLLEDPRNVRELLALTAHRAVQRIDLDRLQIEKSSFVGRDFRHVESDVVLTAPLRSSKADSHRERRVVVYILIEHQSEPDRSMPVRLLMYVAQIYWRQLREWTRHNASRVRLRLNPVLPVLLYTGNRRWDAPGTLVELVNKGQLFHRETPAMEPLFVNLAALRLDQLQRRDGFFTWLLLLMKQRKSRTSEFKRLLARVTAQFTRLAPEQRSRWLELLSFVHAVIYHDREVVEQSELQDTIEASVLADRDRQEVSEMIRSMADIHREQGFEQGRAVATIESARSTLLRLLQHRFGDLPQPVIDTIQATSDIEKLNVWLDGIVMAKTLEEIQIH